MACGTTWNGDAGSDGGSNKKPKTDSLRIEPAEIIREVAYGTEVQVSFRALFTPLGGSETEVTADFSLDLSIGTFVGSTLTSPGTRAGAATVRAEYRGIEANAALTLRVHADVVLDGLSPGLIQAALSGTNSPGLIPTWSYPEEETVIPPNLRGITWRWQAQAGTDAFLLEFVRDLASIRVLTNSDRVVLSEMAWELFVTFLGPGVIEATLSAFSIADPTRVGRATRWFRRSLTPLQGAMYYWSSNGSWSSVSVNEDITAPRGYFRYDFADAKFGEQSELFLGFNRAGDRCVGCHALSRDGSRLATSFEFDREWSIVDVASAVNPVTWLAEGEGNFSAFTPDGIWLLTTLDSTIRAFEISKSGAREAVCSTAPLPASHIAVSPSDGTTVLYVEDMAGSGGTNVERGRIVRLRWDPGTRKLSDRTVLIEETGSVYYPAISPDGEWVLYNRVASGSSLSNPQAEVWIRRLDGGMPRPLSNANQAKNLTNSWPRWTPFEADDGESGRRFFFTFSSVRSNGLTTGHPQLWLATFAPDASEDVDPSSPALWLPMQHEELNNHAAQWTEVFVVVE